MPAIIVSVDRNIDQLACDPLSIYKKAADKFDPKNVFILESLSGPSRDRKATILGFNPLLSLEVHEQFALLTGEPDLVGQISESISMDGFEFDSSGHVLLPDSESVWSLLRSVQSQFATPKYQNPSLAYFGYLSYDTIRFIENIQSQTTKTSDSPVIALTVFQTLVYFHAGGTVETLINNSPYWKQRTKADYADLFKVDPLERIDEVPIAYPVHFEVRDTVEKEQFLSWVDKALHHISIGDIYQIQLGHEVQVESEIQPFEVYRALRKNNPSPYMYLAQIGGIDLIGASPELFVRIKDNLIEMRPIAGTVGKVPGVSSHELILSMMRSEKERAEHVMLIDLCRNDIGRVCQPGSLDVDELMMVEEYSHLYHMVSNVRGLLRNGHDAYDVIKASFPAGTMTGAPKVRAMQIIESMEKNRRGIYAGAVGLIGFDGSVNTALCIRSSVYKDGTYYLRASAGVVADSEPEKEWMETFYKMSSVYRAVTGEEMIK